MLRKLCIIAVIALAPGVARADSASQMTQAGTARAEVMTPLLLSHWTGFTLRFGRFSAGQAGTVTVSPAGVTTFAGGVDVAPGSTTSTDRFIVQGEANRQITITTGSGTVTAGANSMAFTTTPSLPSGYIPVIGVGYFTVGGTLSVNGGQAPGTYSGSYAVTVAYN